MTSISAKTEATLRSAILRLLARGQRMSVKALATEAGLSRATVYRAPHILAVFRATAIDAMNADPRSQIKQLKARIAALRGKENEELLTLRETTRRMAQHIQALTLLTAEQRARIETLEQAVAQRRLRAVSREDRG